MQYLGAKNRSLNTIIEECSKYSKGGYILDLFAGSTIVSQALSSTYNNVISNDIQMYSKVFANATLKINYETKDFQHFFSLLDDITSNSIEYKFYSKFKTFVEKEKELLHAKNSEKLMLYYSTFPNIWRECENKSQYIEKLHKSLQENIDRLGFNIGPIVTLNYAGTYFGIKQSLDLDYLRNSIEEIKRKEYITEWEYNMFLTCLLSVVSKIVFSAGKHFAQPVSSEGVLRSSILNQRLLTDRSYDVLELFNKTVKSFLKHSEKISHAKNNISLNNSMESFLEDDLELPKIDVIYADPPYTAQQYSRFYHIPEVIVQYKIPKLQIHKGSVTKGIYPEDKYKSRFCSKTKVKEAFKDLFKLTKKLDSVLILSYSESKNNTTGNERMIDLTTLDQLQQEIIPEYNSTKVEFNFDYKQLNNSKFIDNKKSDKEILLVYSKKVR
ncbi:MAG: DNA adenine methylase [Campylobacteraceae bacterium]|nr:DNA adenine methylase [Campylobacteraceae bacterium]